MSRFERLTDLDRCCGNFKRKLSGENVPNPEHSGVTITVYARCYNCGALTRDIFRETNEVKYIDNTTTDHPFVSFDESFEWEFDYIDTNDLHNGEAVIVYTPDLEAYNPVEIWRKNEYLPKDELVGLEEVNFNRFEKQQTYSYQYSEIDPATIPE